MNPSKELEAFFEYITITKGLSAKSIEAYRNDLLKLEAEANKPLLYLQSD